MLIDHPDGAAHFGAWIAIVQIASKQNPRGTLPNGKISQSVGGICQSLSRISRLPSSLFENLIPRLIEIGWLEILADSANASGASANTSAESASTSGKSADTDIHTDREGKGIQRKSVETNTISKPSHISERSAREENGNGWTAFIEAYEATGRETISSDFSHCEANWKKLVLADQIACVSGIRRDIEAQKYSGPEFWPKPKNYIAAREWERKIKPRKKKQTLGERMAAL